MGTDAAGEREEKRRQLYLRQRETLTLFLRNGAITRAQYDKSLGDLTAKMGMEELYPAEILTDSGRRDMLNAEKGLAPDGPETEMFTDEKET